MDTTGHFPACYTTYLLVSALYFSSTEALSLYNSYLCPTIPTVPANMALAHPTNTGTQLSMEYTQNKCIIVSCTVKKT